MSGSALLWARRAMIAAVLTGMPALVYARHDATAATVTRFHLALSRAEPRINDTVTTSPAAIKLWFTESVQAAAVSVRLTGPQDHAIALSAVAVDTAAKSPAIVKVTEALAPGTYKVAWRALAGDGHPGTGFFVFAIRATSEK